MTFEELEILAKEQNSRIFSLNCSFVYETLNDFDNIHYKYLKNDIADACPVAINNIKFPFEHIVTNVDFLLPDSKNLDSLKTITAVSFKFHIYILNLPNTSLTDMKNLIYNFVEYFDNTIVHGYDYPVKVQSASFLLILSQSHSLFKVLHNNNLI